MSAGQGIGAVVGATIGFFLGGPAGAIYGAQIGVAVGGYLDPPKGPTVQGPRLNDLAVQTSTYGALLPRVYGTVALHGNILWLENNQLKETVRKKKSGGKGGGSSTTVKTYTYSATFILSLCQGPIAGVRRIWCSDKLIYNAGSDDLETIIASNQAASGWKLYRGTDDQLPDPRYEADVGVGNAPAYRGEAYIAFYDFQLADYSNTLQGAQFKVEVVSQADTQIPALIESFTAEGAIGSASSVFFQAYTIKAGTITGGIGGTYASDVEVVEYTTTGAVASRKTLSSSVPVEGSANLAFYTARYIHGKASSIATISRGASTYKVSFSDFPALIGTGAITLTGVSGSISQYWSYAGGYYWCGSITAAARVEPGSGDVQLYSLPNSGTGGYENYFIAEDAATGKVYARWRESGAGASGLGYFGELDPESLTLVWYESIGATVTDSVIFSIHAGVMCLKRAVGSPIVAYDVSSGTLQVIGSVATASTDYNVYKVSDSVIYNGGALYRIDQPVLPGLVPLAEIIVAEASASSLIAPADVDASLLSDGVRGYRVQGGSIRSALEPLQGAFPFDVIPSGYQIKCVPRGQASVVTIPWQNLGASDSEPGDLLQRSREMDSQLPARVAIKYLDAAREYAIAEQLASRDNTPAINRVDRELPLVLNADEAAGVADVLLNLPWLEREDFSFSLPPIYLHLEPADVTAVAMPYASFELRLTEINYSQDGRLECKAKLNRAPLYNPAALGSEGVPPTGTIPLAGPTVWLPLDIPVVDETIQNSPGFVSVAFGYSAGWPGAVAFRSTDSGQTWVEVQGYTGVPSIGNARGTLPASSGTLIDQRTLTVDVIVGEPESITRDQMLSGQNYAAYGADGRWEIVRFQNAVLQSDGSYLISHFVRGDKGTEWATGLHQAGDWFVLLDDPDNVFVDMAIGSIGIPATYRGVTSGASIDSASDVPFTYQGVNLECLSPVNAKGSRDGSGNFTGTFTRRSRLSSTWWTNGVQAPVGETAEAYEIDVMNGSTVVRTINSSTNSFSYTAAQQTTDFGSAQASITLRIYQLSEVVGRGYQYQVTL